MTNPLKKAAMKASNDFQDIVGARIQVLEVIDLDHKIIGFDIRRHDLPNNGKFWLYEGLVIRCEYNKFCTRITHWGITTYNRDERFNKPILFSTKGKQCEKVMHEALGYAMTLMLTEERKGQ